MNNNKKYVLIGCDSNPYYFDFWPIISKAWKLKFGYIPVLGLICNEDSDLISDEYGLVKKFKKIDSIAISLQTQIVRLFLSKFLDGECLISDIDMLPLSISYFKKISNLINDNNIIVYSSDNAECLKVKQFPMCYINATSNTYRKIFDLDLSWVEFCNKLNSMNNGWYSDQLYIYEKILKYKDEFNDNVILLNRGWINNQAINRIDRINWRFNSEYVKQGVYIDSHLLRPYSKYKNEVDCLICLLYE